MRIVIALGGNALLRRGEPQDLATQEANARRAALAIAAVLPGNELIVTHGNGPQIGRLAMQAVTLGQPVPLDMLNAETDGMIGYVLARELINATGSARVATLLTQIAVDRADPGFGSPTKFIGPVFKDVAELSELANSQRWQIARDGAGWRRVVASPQPQEILEIEAIRALTQTGHLVICAGGGGIPVVRGEDGQYTGIECVIDKDLSSGLLATQLHADRFIMLTDVSAVFADWGTAQARALRQVTPDELLALPFPAGSMGPKVEAACRFARGGGKAGIGALEDLPGILAEQTGTTISLWPA
jgi:carbamate kinase